MATQTIGWEATYQPLKPVFFDTGYPSLTLYRGDDIVLATTCALRAAESLLSNDEFLRLPVDLTGAQLVWTMVPADPDDPNTTVVTKTNAVGGGITITDAVNGLCQIALAAADFAAVSTTVYRCFLRARWTVNGVTTTGTVGMGVVFIIDPNLASNNWAFTAGQ